MNPRNQETFTDLLKWRARHHGKKTAFTFLEDGERESATLTYSELDEKARQLAVRLLASGAEGKPVLLLLPSSLEFMIAFCGCLYARAIAVPAYIPGKNRADERILAMVADAEIGHILTIGDSRSRTKLEKSLGFLGEREEVTWIAVDEPAQVSPASWQGPPISSEDLAFLQYTSGSTSTPKGVMVSHGNVMANEAMMATAFEVDEHEVFVTWAPLYHDMGLIGNMLQSLYLGATCYLMSPTAFLVKPLRWLAAISKYGGTMSGGPNFAYDLCVEKISGETRGQLDLSHWKIAANGAEPISARTLARFSEAFATCGFRAETMYPCYGLAEATLFVSGSHGRRLPHVSHFNGGDLAGNRVVALGESDRNEAAALVGNGRSFHDLDLRIVVPESFQECPPGQVGEIWVRGSNIARGYWGRKEESARTFGARLAGTAGPSYLRTGDLGFVHDGELYVTGRLKDLIIFRGRNIYPQDLELTASRAHPAAQPGSAAAFSVASDLGERVVVVQEIRRTHRKGDMSAVAKAIRQRLAEDHEILVHTLVLAHPLSIPKTTSGKVQRKACQKSYLDGSLKSLGVDELSPEVTGLAVFNRDALLILPREDRAIAIERALCRAVAGTLGIETENIDTAMPLPSLGLDSLAVINVQHQLERQLALNLAIRELLETGLETLSKLLADALSPQPELAAQTLPALDESRKHELSYGQRAMWFLQQMAPESAVYNLVRAAQIRGPLDPDALRRAFRALQKRHPLLNCAYTEQGGRPRQVQARQLVEDFAQFDASGWDEASLYEHLSTEAETPFDLSQPPLIRIRLYRKSDRDNLLLLSIHHIVADLWSFSVLLKELGEVYRAETSGSPLTLPKLEHSYAHYVNWQRDMLDGDQGRAHWAYWQSVLSGNLPVLDLPFDRPRRPFQTFAGAVLTSAFDPGLTERLASLGKAAGGTLYTTLVAAFQVFLHRYTGQDDVLVGSPSAGRSRADFDGVLGYFVNPIVLRARFGRDVSFLDFLIETRQSLLGALEHQDFPFMLIAERLQPNRDLSHAPIFNVMFSYQRSPELHDQGLAGFALEEPEARMSLGGLEWESLPLARRGAQLDLTLMVTELKGCIRAAFEYNSDLFDRETIARMAANFDCLLTGIAAAPERSIADLPLLSQPEREHMLVQWNRTDHSFPETQTIHGTFEAQAFKTPAAMALAFENRQLSFGQLNRAANQLANYLKRKGVGPDRLVGLCIPRSIEMTIGLLAILKAGGAYVPLDPDYPEARLRGIVADSGMKLLLTVARTMGICDTASVETLVIDQLEAELSRESEETRPIPMPATNLAYVMYTSGSTGTPKGVGITHRNVINFFAAMDQRIGCRAGQTLLAVTSISFDISVLELFWTLAGGCGVLLASERALAEAAVPASKSRPSKPISFSLFYFASDEAKREDHKYRLLQEGARFADEHGFEAVWTPERHFHEFGGRYPNPSLTSAYLAGITKRVDLRAGSVVLPLHDPVRVAEEWAVVDNLSAGRVGIACASGWNTNDFVLQPDRYEDRRQIMFQDIGLLQHLWQGGVHHRKNGRNVDFEFKIFPKPIQETLPIWITSGGEPSTFSRAGELGANILTHLLGQSLAEVAEKIEGYRRTLAEHGHDPESGRVTLMMHTYLGEDLESVRARVRGPFRDYLRSSVGLIRNLARSLNLPYDLDRIEPHEMEQLLDIAFERYFETSALFGTVSSCQAMIDNLKRIGVDEVACLIDFGIDEDEVLAGLNRLNLLRRSTSPQVTTANLLDQAEQYGVTHLQCTPSTMTMLAANPRTFEALASLEVLMLGGEALPPELARVVTAQLNAALHNMYGPTETTIWSTTQQIPADEDRITIGTAIANTQVYIVTKRLELAPIGVAGELVIGGEGLARGYYRRPSLTAIKFVPDPFSTIPGARLYMTGDRARAFASGRIEHLGRLDFQVKLRGYRIELGEIETVISAYPGIREAVALVRETAAGGQQLAAFYVAEKPGSLDKSELHERLRKRLPAFMVPAVLSGLERFPLTPNGKIDRVALGAQTPEEPALGTGADFVPPRTQVEEILAGIWVRVLGLERIGLHDHFFSSGGHSLAATQMISRLREVFSIEIPLRTIFENPTINQLAPQVERLGREHRGRVLPELKPLADSLNPALSFIQQRLWVLDQLEPDNRAYNHAYLLQIEGALDAGDLERAIQAVVQRQGSLRTIFPVVDTSPVQILSDNAVAPLQRVDLTYLPEPEREPRARNLAREEGLKRFELDRGPLLRCALFQLDSQRHFLLLAVHFIVADGWSMELIFSEVGAHYRALREKHPVRLADLPVQYPDYSAWQRGWLRDEVLAKQLAFWKSRLENPPTLALPVDYPRPKLQTTVGDIHAVSLDKELTARLRNLCRQEEATLFMGLLSGFSALLARYAHQRDFVIGFPVANRTHPALENLVGCFVNTLPLRVDLSGDPSFRELLGRVRNMMLECHANQDIPFELLVQELDVTRDLSRSPLFQVMLLVQKPIEVDRGFGGLGMALQHFGLGTSKYDLTLDLNEGEHEIKGVFEYNTALFAADTIAAMTRHLLRILDTALADPDRKVFELPLLAAQEQLEILSRWNQTNREYPRGRATHQFFEDQVARRPDASALWFEGEYLSYRELNRRANQLAHYLRRLGSAPDQPVGLCLERSPEMVVGLLAIMKAGSSYVPMDPTYPTDRLAHMVVDSGMRLVLIQGETPAFLEALDVTPICLGQSQQARADESGENPNLVIPAEQLAYVIYTSGSTGKPKGVQISHQALVNFIFTMAQAPGLNESDTFLSVTTLSFDIMGLEVYGPLLVGATLALASRQVSGDSRELATCLSQCQATVMQATPTTWRMLLESGWRGKPDLAILCGGDLLPLDLARRLARCGRAFWNLYGPTETTIWSMAQLLEPPVERVLIGKPIANTQIYLLDERFQPVPNGVSGDLYIGGEGLARGYWRQPALTAARFLPDPFTTLPGGRLYCTGDSARALPDGIEFLGRLDFQVKLRGFRIELGDIEYHLNTHPEIRQAVVLLRGEREDERRLTAYLVAEPDQTPHGAQLQVYLQDKLPAYMIPAVFTHLPALPLTPNGKVDRKALPEVRLTREQAGTEYVEPRTQLETLLVRIWKQALRIERVGVRDQFFEIGGNSLLATQIAIRIRETLDAVLPLHHFFEATTIEKVARILVQNEPKPGLLEKKAQLIERIKNMSPEERQALRERKQQVPIHKASSAIT